MNWDYIAGYFDGEGSVWSAPHGSGSSKVSLVWSNTHEESLAAMQSFMGCGRLRERNQRQPHHKRSFTLVVSDRKNLRRVMDELIPRCIIKREALIAARPIVEGLRIVDNWGVLPALGVDEVSSLYQGGLTQAEIGQRVGVHPTAVRNYMKRHGIAARPPGVPHGHVFVETHLTVDDVTRMYHAEGLSQQAIADKIGTNQAQVSLFMRRHDIPRRRPGARKVVAL